jgi:TnpA family transposase
MHYPQLGRIVKTIFILKYLSDEKLRRKVQKKLNRGEQRHGLANSAPAITKK